MIEKYLHLFETLFQIDDKDFTKVIPRQTILYFINDSDYWMEEILPRLHANCTGLIFIEYVTQSEKMKIGFERKEDLAMFMLRFKNEQE